MLHINLDFFTLKILFKNIQILLTMHKRKPRCLEENETHYGFSHTRHQQYQYQFYECHQSI